MEAHAHCTGTNILSSGFVSPTANIDRNSLFANKLNAKKGNENGTILWKLKMHAQKLFRARRKLSGRVYFIKTYKSLRTEWLTKLFTNFSQLHRASLALDNGNSSGGIAIHELFAVCVCHERVIFVTFNCALLWFEMVLHANKIQSAPRMGIVMASSEWRRAHTTKANRECDVARCLNH